MTERLGIFISGSGTTAAELAEACENSQVQLELATIIASNKEAGSALGALQKKIVVIDPQDFPNAEGKTDQEKFGCAILAELLRANVQVVSQNGWLPFTPQVVIDHYANAIFNQHPGPKFETKGTHGRQPLAIMVLLAAAGYPMRTEVIVHRVNEKFDEGAVVGRKRVFFHELGPELKELQKIVEESEQKDLSVEKLVDALPLDPLIHRLRAKTLKAEHTLVVGVMSHYPQIQDISVQPTDQKWTPDYQKKVKLARQRARKKYPHG